MQGSWATKIGMRLRNVRRAPRGHKTGLKFEPPSKKGKENRTHHCWSEPRNAKVLDSATYQRHKEAIRAECKHIGKKRNALLALMRETSVNRRSWITTETPSVKTIIEEFPCLQDYQIVSRVLDLSKKAWSSNLSVVFPCFRQLNRAITNQGCIDHAGFVYILHICSFAE